MQSRASPSINSRKLRRAFFARPASVLSTSSPSTASHIEVSSRRARERSRSMRAITDTPRWRVDDALEGRVIVAIGDQAQISQRILDFGTIEETLPTVHAIGDVVLDELLLEIA